MFDKQLEEVEKLKTGIKVYTYEYYEVDSETKNLIFSKDNSKYGNTREGYEDFSRDIRKGSENSIQIEHSGQVHARNIKENGEIIGMILESNNNTYVEESTEKAKELYEDAFKEMCTNLEVKDIESFTYYFENSNLVNDFGTSFNNLDNVSFYKNSIKSLQEFMELYIFDSDVKKLVDKIKS